jgi:DNA-directed RNA polymerase specialized sigma24 family protein
MDEFREFFEASRDRVFRAVLALVGDPSLAETAVIDAYAAAYRAWHAGQSGTTTEAWVLRSALSGRGPQRREPSEPSPSTDEPAPDLTSAQERAEAARVAVRRLPRRLRGVIAMHLVAGLSAKETAGLVGLPADTVDRQLVAGLALLRQVMAPGSEATEPEEEEADTGPVDVSYDLDASYELGVPLATRIFARAPKPVVVVVTDDEVTAWVIEAFADQHLDASLPDLEPEPPRSRFQRRRDWVIPFVAVPAIAVAVAAVLLGVLGGFGRLLGSTPAAAGSASPVPATPCRGCDWDESAFATDCLGKWANAAPRASDLRPQDRAIVPPLRFAFRDAQFGVRLFATGTVLFTCTRDEAGQARGVISGRPAANESFLPDTPSPLDYLAVLDLSGGPEYFLGRLPDGARRVIARTTQGQEIPGVINGDLFAVWAPHGGLGGAQVHAYAGNREISSGPPTFLRGGFSETAFTQACGVRILDLLQAAEDLPPAEREVPPVRFRWREGEWAMWFYGTDRTLLECKLLPNGAIEVSGGWFDVNQGWSTMQPLDLQSDVGRLGWAFGRAIDGAERIEVNLSDGRVVFAQVKDGVFAAAWFNGVDTNVGPQTVTALTPDLIYSRDAAGTLSTRPR